MQKLLLILTLFTLLNANDSDGKEVFETYCWGCHHQSAEAFGPSFTEIASKRTKEEIEAMITDPQSVSKAFGYKRNAMPKLKLTPKELNAISDYILSYKKEDNRTIIKEEKK